VLEVRYRDTMPAPALNHPWHFLCLIGAGLLQLQRPVISLK